MERKLKSEIQQRTGLLARAQQTELFNIREVLRAERKNLTKVSETAENTYRVTQQEIKQMRTEIARKNKETQDRMDKQSVQTHTLVREVDQRITMTKKATDQELFHRIILVQSAVRLVTVRSALSVRSAVPTQYLNRECDLLIIVRNNKRL